MSLGSIEALFTAVLTLALVVARPRALNEGLAALLGAGLVLLLGLVPVGTAVQLELGNWNVFLFFLGMMALTALVDQSGAFDRLAFAVTRVAGGEVRPLYLALLVLSALIALLFTNDAAALVLTPIVYSLVLRLKLAPLPFVFATTFMADTASIGLPVSNPLNIIVADRFHLGLAPYIQRLWLPAILAVAINAVIFLVLFRRGLKGGYQPVPQLTSRPGLPSTFALLGAVAIAYIIASAAQFSLGIVALAGAVVMAMNQLRLRAFHLKQLAGDISWTIFGFLAGMVVVVQGLHHAGITAVVGRTLIAAAHGPKIVGIAAGVFGTAVGSNVVNNLPMALIMTTELPSAHLTHAVRLDLAYATIVGCDLGPNLTHLGSLATFLWLFFLRRKGLDVSTWDYLRVGVLVTPLMLAAATVALWLTSAP